MFAQVVRFATVSVLAASFLAPTAGAGRYSLAAPSRTAAAQQPVATCHQYCAGVPTRGSQAPETRSLVRTELVSSPDVFDWADAALGFGLAVGLGAIGLALLSVFPGRDTRVRHAGSAS
jgi:hypothetical protein